VLGVHRVDGDQHTGQVEAYEKGSYGWDLVALGGDGELAQDRATGMV